MDANVHLPPTLNKYTSTVNSAWMWVLTCLQHWTSTHLLFIPHGCEYSPASNTEQVHIYSSYHMDANVQLLNRTMKWYLQFESTLKFCLGIKIRIVFRLWCWVEYFKQELLRRGFFHALDTTSRFLGLCLISSSNTELTLWDVSKPPRPTWHMEAVTRFKATEADLAHGRCKWYLWINLITIEIHQFSM